MWDTGLLSHGHYKLPATLLKDVRDHHQPNSGLCPCVTVPRLTKQSCYIIFLGALNLLSSLTNDTELAFDFIMLTVMKGVVPCPRKCMV